jgi:uncharacterized protein (DUF1015 family)
MADVQPLRALHYDVGKAGAALDRLISPPYDVIDARKRAELVARSPHNAVAIDLPEGPDRYRKAGELLEEWKRGGVLARDPEPAIWALTQAYVGPDGAERVRSGFFARVRLTDYGPGRVRPHERTHPAAKQDRLMLMRATRANLSPIFALYADADQRAWSALASTSDPPWGEAEDDDGTRHRLWRITDQAAIETVHESLANSELLIADGHHRYETARTYAEEVGGEGDHSYVLMYLVSLLDPGLEIFATHRLVKGVDAAGRERLEQMLERNFRARRVEPAELAPPPVGNGSLPVYGFIDRENGRALRLELASADPAERALASHEATYRQLDTAVLEKLVLEQALGMSEDDISHQRGLGYTQSTEEALSLVESGEYELAFLLRPTPVEQVKAIAEAGETMPPKSTYFYPKVPSGLIFNPLD